MIDRRLVAPPKARCLVCGLPDVVRLAVNAAIWDADGERVPQYAAKASRVIGGAGHEVPARETIVSHVRHTEASWEMVDAGDLPSDPAATELRASTFDGLTDAASELGARALAALDRAMPGLTPKELLEVSKLAVRAAGARETIRAKRGSQRLEIAAIFALVRGDMTPAEDSNIIDVTPSLDVLREEVATERRLLTERAGRSVVEEEDDLGEPPI